MRLRRGTTSTRCAAMTPTRPTSERRSTIRRCKARRAPQLPRESVLTSPPLERLPETFSALATSVGAARTRSSSPFSRNNSAKHHPSSIRLAQASARSITTNPLARCPDRRDPPPVPQAIDSAGGERPRELSRAPARRSREPATLSPRFLMRSTPSKHCPRIGTAMGVWGALCDSIARDTLRGDL
jgi:hypothetical protein